MIKIHKRERALTMSHQFICIILPPCGMRASERERGSNATPPLAPISRGVLWNKKRTLCILNFFFLDVL
jgi:hypothetical protein